MVLIIRKKGQNRLHDIYVPLFELSIIPCLFLLLWLRAPLTAGNVIDLSILIILFSGILFIVRKDFIRKEALLFSLEGFLPSIKLLLTPTLIICIVSIIWYLYGGNNTFDSFYFGVSLITYPVYAFCQLIIFLYIPLKRFQKLSKQSVQHVIIISAIFGLFHWPNHLTVVSTCLLMVFWAYTYRKHQNILAISLVFGITATFTVQLLPTSLTQNVTIGPSLVNKLIVTGKTDRSFNQLYDLLLENADDAPDSFDFVKNMYTIIIQKEPVSYQYHFWNELRNLIGEKAVVSNFLSSSEISNAGWYKSETLGKQNLISTKGQLDFFKLDKGVLKLDGWAVHRDTLDLPLEYLLFINGKLIHSVAPNNPRPDLPSIKKNVAIKGFSFNLTIEHLQPMLPLKEIRLIARYSNNLLMEIKYPQSFPWARKQNKFENQINQIKSK